MSTMNTVGRPTTPNAVESKPATLTGGRGLLQHEGLIFDGEGWGDVASRRVSTYSTSGDDHSSDGDVAP